MSRKEEGVRYSLIGAFASDRSELVKIVVGELKKDPLSEYEQKWVLDMLARLMDLKREAEDATRATKRQAHYSFAALQKLLITETDRHASKFEESEDYTMPHEDEE